MARHGSNHIAVFLIGGYDFLAQKVQNVARKVEERLQRTDGCGDDWEDSAHTGISAGTFSQDGAFFDDSTNQMHAALKGASPSARVGLIVWGGNVAGAACTGFAGMLSATYEVLAQLAGLTKANATYGIAGQVEDGVLLQPHAALAAATTGTNVDHGSATTDGGAAYLGVSDYAGFTSVAAKVQHSADGSAWVDLVTFAAVAAGPTAQRVAVAGTVNQHTRSVVTPTGVGSITPAIAFARG